MNSIVETDEAAGGNRNGGGRPPKRIFRIILIAALVIAQIVSFVRISNLQTQLDITRAEMHGLHSSISAQMSSIYLNVDGMLRQQATLIEVASTEIVAINPAEAAVSIQFSLIPKEVSEDTAVSLDFDGESIQMARNGTHFSATVSRGIFSGAMPMIVIEDGGTTITTQDSRVGIWHVRDAVLPSLFPRFAGSTNYANGRLTFDGIILIGAGAPVGMAGRPSSTDVSFTEIRLVVMVDEAVVSEAVLPIESPLAEWPFRESIQLGDGQVCTLMLVATNSLGFRHHYKVAEIAGGSAGRFSEFPLGGEKIYSADGALLWERSLLSVR